MTYAGNGPRDLREDLREQVRRPGVRQKMNEALLREATEGAKSGTSVIRAYELVSRILEGGEREEGRDLSDAEDLSVLSDDELIGLIRALEADGREGREG